ncbi:spindle assembly abnormal protein 6 homolog [Notothenia coriiceps]|uniref:Spindle assembly abnormal protein 6 homolog n=1 Tax=Notothenia coriiceps TaxID=8208 RepID=A0A6I9N0Y7_9TELE|nr:PREDICTED: spindle assembly abnormal protein 6 homolog [Notothenia coriiceps]
MEELFCKELQVNVRCRDCEDRKANIRVTIELQLTNGPVHKRDLLVRLTDDLDPYFLFNLSISEEDFQSLKVQQGLLIDFTSFPQKFIDLLNLCYSEQASENPRFLLHLSAQSPVLEGLASFSVVETNAFKHLNHLSLRLVQGSDKEIKDYLAVCLSSLKAEKQAVEMKLKKTEDDLTRQLNYAQQTLSEKTKELDKMRSEWTSQSSCLSSRHSLELQSEREKAAEESMEENAESKELHNRKLEATVKSLSEELIKANGIIKKLQGEVRGLVGKIKLKNTVTVSQEKVLQDTSEKLQSVEKGLQSTQQQLSSKEEQVSKLKEQLETTVQKLNESREVLKTNENVINWLNKQLNEKQLSRKPQSPECMNTPSLLSTAPAQRVGDAWKCRVAKIRVEPNGVRRAETRTEQR